MGRRKWDRRREKKRMRGIKEKETIFYPITEGYVHFFNTHSKSAEEVLNNLKVPQEFLEGSGVTYGTSSLMALIKPHRIARLLREFEDKRWGRNLR